MKPCTILSIETSCDETSVAIVRNGVEVLANIVSSQIETHRLYGGVVPEIASRQHVENLPQVIDETLNRAQLTFADLDAIAVTYGPGLVGALLVGVSAAKAIAFTLNKPLIGVNHLEGHIYANFLVRPELTFPLLCLVVSGGHTDLILLSSHREYKVLGSTLDDAAGEAFDKVARAMGLGYPGGPLVDKLAKEGDPKAIALPRAMLKEGGYDFSFSGLKSAVLNYLNKAQMKGEEINKADLAASFQQAVVEVLVKKTAQAVQEYGVGTVILAGGVAANSALRQALTDRGNADGWQVTFPPMEFCTDNGAMIGALAYYKYINGDFAPLTLNANPSLKINVEKY